MSPDELLIFLQERGLLAGPGASLKSLAGGVSSDIWLVEDGNKKFVLKKARPRLDVSQEWLADVSRNRYEQEFMRYVGEFLPTAVPRILHSDAEQGFFTMEYLGPEFANWKALLLAGIAQGWQAVQAAQTLAAIHCRSWNDPRAKERFAASANFFQLRIDPYLLTTGRRHACLQSFFQEEAERLASAAGCLIHGDYSPKNILFGPGRMVILDCEVACFGDPAFDVAFLLNHLFLKALLFRDNPEPFLELAKKAWEAYSQDVNPEVQAGLEERTCRLLLMLLLARIDGKSPVEYLADEGSKDLVRSFVARHLPQVGGDLLLLQEGWGDFLRQGG